jgi:hypothetical protein
MILIEKKREKTIRKVFNKWVSKSLTHPIVKVRNSKNILKKIMWSFIFVLLFSILAQKITFSILEYYNYKSLVEINHYKRGADYEFTIAIILENPISYSSLLNTLIVFQKDEINKSVSNSTLSTIENFHMSYKNFLSELARSYEEDQELKDLKDFDNFNGFLTNSTNISIISCYFNDQICNREDFTLIGSDDPSTYPPRLEFKYERLIYRIGLISR